MPFINIKTNASVSKEQETALKSAMGQAIAAIPGKSENWLMVGIEPEQILYFKGDDAPAAMVDVSIYGGAQRSAYDRLTAEICRNVSEQLSVEQSRIYVKYTEIENWGWNGSNF